MTLDSLIEDLVKYREQYGPHGKLISIKVGDIICFDVNYKDWLPYKPPENQDDAS